MNNHNPQGSQTLFRVYTEDVYRVELRKIVCKHFPDGAFINYGEGIWDGSEPEQSALIEVYGMEFDRGEVTSMAHEIKEAFGQQAVLIVELSDRLSYYTV